MRNQFTFAGLFFILIIKKTVYKTYVKEQDIQVIFESY